MVICAERQPPRKPEKPCRPGRGAEYLLDVHGDAERERPGPSEMADEQGGCSVDSGVASRRRRRPVNGAGGQGDGRVAQSSTQVL
jgi:hypothetical protein